MQNEWSTLKLAAIQLKHCLKEPEHAVSRVGIPMNAALWSVKPVIAMSSAGVPHMRASHNLASNDSLGVCINGAAWVFRVKISR
jgi:hypothetical protein